MLPPGNSDERGRLGEALIRRLTSIRSRWDTGAHPGIQRVVLGLAIAVFVVGGVWAYQRLDVEPGDLRWAPVLVAGFVGVPLAMSVNVAEYSVSASMTGHRVGFVAALRVTVVASAANLLPLPGGPLVRVQALRGLGATYRRAFAVTVFLAAVWAGVTALLAGTLILLLHSTALGIGILLAGMAGFTVACLLLRSEVGDGNQRVRHALAAVAVETASAGVAGFRLFLVLQGLGFDATITDALVLALAGVLTSATGFVPGGLGVQELLSAALAPIVGLPPAAGFAASALDRVIGVFLYSPLGVILLIQRRLPSGSRQRGTNDEHDPSSSAGEPPGTTGS